MKQIDRIVEYLEKQDEELWKKINFLSEHNMNLEKQLVIEITKVYRDLRYKILHGELSEREE